MRTDGNQDTINRKNSARNDMESDQTSNNSGNRRYVNRSSSFNDKDSSIRSDKKQGLKNKKKNNKKNNKKNSKNTILVMLIVALAILTAYYYITAGKTKPQKTEEQKAMNAQAEEILKLDLEHNYPKNPKEVVEIYSRITQSMYSNVDDKYIKELGAKARMIYDEEFLALNPEDKYYNELLTNIATWRDNGRVITKYIVLGEEYSKYRIIDGIEYQTEYVLYTFKEEAKASQYWAFLLRKSKEGQWKIAGWEAVESSSMSPVKGK